MSEKEVTDLPKEAQQFLDHLSVERGASRHTLISYARDLKDFFSKHDELTGATALRHLAHLRELGLAESSVARKISTLRSFEDFLALKDRSRIGWEVDLKSHSRRLPKSLPLETIQRLIDGVGKSPTGARDKAILETLYATGMRVSECVALDVDQLLQDPQGTYFLRIIGKGGKERLVPVGTHATTACKDYLVRTRPSLLRDRRETALFLNGRGGRLSRQSIWQAIKQAASRAGIKEEITPHTLRHAFATHMLERGADVRSVQELLGHASVVTTQIYTLVTNDVVRETHATSHPRAK